MDFSRPTCFGADIVFLHMFCFVHLVASLRLRLQPNTPAPGGSGSETMEGGGGGGGLNF